MTGPRRLLHEDARGSTLVEFALIAPVMLLLIMVLADLAFQSYVQAVLTGAVQKAARDSTVQGAAVQTDTLDARVERAVRGVITSPTFNSATDRRKNYDNYASISGEPFTDSADGQGKYDGICNNKETYVDVNGNGQYDLDLSSGGQGSANDVTSYRVTVTYQRLFPLSRTLLGSTATLAAATILKNQPYATQTTNSGTSTGKCA